MPKKVALGLAAGATALSLALGIGLYTADHGPARHTGPTAESRPPADGELRPPPPPAQLKPSERVVVTPSK